MTNSTSWYYESYRLLRADTLLTLAPIAGSQCGTGVGDASHNMVFGNVRLMHWSFLHRFGSGVNDNSSGEFMLQSNLSSMLSSAVTS